MNFWRAINEQRHTGLCRTCIYFLCVAWIVGGCSTQPKQPDIRSSTVTTSILPTTEYSVTELLELAEQSASPQTEQYLLAAISQLLEQGKYIEAQSLNDRIIPETLPEPLKIQRGLLLARLAIADSRPDQALSELTKLEEQSYSRINVEQQIALTQLRSHAYELQQNYIDSARELIFLEPLVESQGDQASQKNNRSIWRALMNSPLSVLQSHLSDSADSGTQGWLELAAISKNIDLGIDQQLRQLESWQAQYPHHPLSDQLPDEINVLTEIKQSSQKNIALLLPLQGQLSGAGKAVLNGFMGAVFRSQELGNNQPTVRIYDTSRDSHIATVYWQAISDGADLVIGPLKQENVERLADIELPIPVLSLNYIRDSNYRSTSLYQFGLASEDSARMAARQAKDAGQKKAIIIYPDTDWGTRNATAFSDEFLELGGEVLTLQAFDTPKQYAKIIQQTLLVSDSKNRIHQVNRILDKPATTQVRRRKDVDFIFLVALPGQGRQIKPLLNYYYADGLPIYSISNIYSGVPETMKDADLNGIIFNETPWLVVDDLAGKNEVKLNWPASFELYPRLYALGADAYRIYPRLKQLELLPFNGMYAYTGYLKLTDNRKIERSLKPVIFNNGSIKALPHLTRIKTDAQ
ncbi:MAG: penicillin-binding protein activator [Proteobacteria bacterium]|nr:penicillin-binding protein activator [Pseudomonadota bacterium]